MKTKNVLQGLAVAAGLIVPAAASAMLIDRGMGLIYDSTQDITWLQDANFCATNPTDAACVAASALLGGQMNWTNANLWADNLVFAGFDDWRLPITGQPDPSCSSQFDPGGGMPLQGFGTGCTGSEVGHLFNVDGVSSSMPGLFDNVQPFFYWSATEFAPNPGNAWNFNFNNGNQNATNKNNTLFGWAVRPGE